MVQVTINTPIGNQMAERTLTIGQNAGQRAVLLNRDVIANGSGIFSNTVTLKATAEVSVLLLVYRDSGNVPSIMSTRLLPVDVLGLEYFAVTVCHSNECQIQVSATAAGLTRVQFRLRLSDPNDSISFLGVSYQHGDTFCVELQRYESVQLQAKTVDMTGTNIHANKPISVLSGGRQTKYHNTLLEDAVLEQMPPVGTLETNYMAVQAPKNLPSSLIACTKCGDRLRIVAVTGDTNIKILSGKGETQYHLEMPGAWVEVKIDAAVQTMTVTASKPVLVAQVLDPNDQGGVPSVNLGMSILTPTPQYINFVKLPINTITGMDNRVMISGLKSDFIKLNIAEIKLNTDGATNVSFLSESVVSTFNSDAFTIDDNGNNIPFGGHMYATGNNMGLLYPMPAKMAILNEPCHPHTGTRGDGIDNDCDGDVDEEDCLVFSSTDATGSVMSTSLFLNDLDSDGMSNEDCRFSATLPVSSLQSTVTSLPIQSDNFQPIAGTLTVAVTPTITVLTSAAVDSTSTVAVIPTMTVMTSAASNSQSLSLVASSPDSTAIQPSSVDISSVDISSVSSTYTTALMSASFNLITSLLCGGCNCHATPVDVASSELEEIASSIEKELTVDKTKVSATRRAKESAKDDRPSSQTMGILGLVMVVSTFVGIFLLDAPTLAFAVKELIIDFKGSELEREKLTMKTVPE